SVFRYCWSVRLVFFFSSRRRHTIFSRDWSSDVCSSDLEWAVSPRRAPWARLFRRPARRRPPPQPARRRHRPPPTHPSTRRRPRRGRKSVVEGGRVGVGGGGVVLRAVRHVAAGARGASRC